MKVNFRSHRLFFRFIKILLTFHSFISLEKVFPWKEFYVLCFSCNNLALKHRQLGFFNNFHKTHLDYLILFYMNYGFYYMLLCDLLWPNSHSFIL